MFNRMSEDAIDIKLVKHAEEHMIGFKFQGNNSIGSYRQ